jgi:hypothetical protein
MPREMDLVNGAQRYESATLRAFWEEVIARLRGKPARLLSFEEVRECLRLWREMDRGLQDIPVNQIVGSVGRPNDFTGSFLPKPAVDRDRWSRIFAETVGDLGLPPIEVYQVGDEYYVRDGNHRVSVARDMGFKTIEARVTEVTGIGPQMLNPCLGED